MSLKLVPSLRCVFDGALRIRFNRVSLIINYIYLYVNNITFISFISYIIFRSMHLLEYLLVKLYFGYVCVSASFCFQAFRIRETNLEACYHLGHVKSTPCPKCPSDFLPRTHPLSIVFLHTHIYLYIQFYKYYFYYWIIHTKYTPTHYKIV